MTLYDVLGVGPTATAAELRAAYLTAARRAHPDVVGAAGEATMRDLNNAWSVLGDAESRRAYDLTLPSAPGAPGAPGDSGSAPSPSPRVRITRPVERPFEPYHPVDEDDDDRWRSTDDATDPETAAGSFLQLAPIVVVLAGVVILAGGLLVDARRIAVFGVVIVLLGFAGFLVAPLAVMARASTVEHRRERERQQRRRP